MNFDIFPTPYKVKYCDGNYTLNSKIKNTDDLYSVYEFLKSDYDEIIHIIENSFENDEYKISICDKGIFITYSTQEGLFRASATLKQIFIFSNNTLPFMELWDKPDYKVRGLMLDISRGKIPNLEYLKGLVRLMADMKYNHLQLYMDNFCYYYKDFPEYMKGEEPLTVEEVKELEDYCEKYFIELVPCQNSFGHLETWLTKEELKPLGIERENGKNPFSLNPLDKRSVKLVDKIFHSVLPNFKSDYVNIGFDETFGLGMGDTKKACSKYGEGRVFLDFFNKIYELANKKYNKKVMLWGDMIVQYPKELKSLNNKDVIAMEWGYSFEHPFYENCRLMHENDIEFYVCPGTCSWKSFAGRSDVYCFNIKEAAEVGKKFGSRGFVLTDWGNHGHPHFPIISYIPYALGAQYAWRVGEKTHEYLLKTDYIDFAKKFIDMFILKCDLSDIIFRLSSYSQLEHEKFHDGTVCAYIILTELQNDIFLKRAKPIYYKNIIRYIRDIINEIHVKKCNEVIKRQLINNANMVVLSAEIILYKLNSCSKSINEIRDFSEEIIKEFEELWKLDNHTKGVNIFIDLVRNTVNSL